MNSQSHTGGLKRLKSILTLRRRDERESMINTLKVMYEEIRDGNGTFYESDVLPSIGIECFHLHLDTQPTSKADMFFIPMSKEDLDKREVDLTDAETKRRFESRGAMWDERRVPEFIRNSPGYKRQDFMSRSHTAEKMCGLIGNNFLSVKRRGLGKEPSTNLKKLTDWRSGSFRNSLVEDEFHPHVFDLYNSPTDPWESRSGLPHVMVSLAMWYPPEEEALQRPELLTILAITISQLKKPRLRAHHVIPIKVLSFCAEQGRILEAYYHYRDQKLVVRASRYYDFSTEEEGLPNVDLFLRHMTCKLEGETRSLNLPKREVVRDLPC